MGIRLRDDDEFLLWLVRQRAAGATPTDLATRLGRTTQYVTTATNRVMEADIEESGEPEAELRTHYWTTKRGGNNRWPARNMA
jgi:hypothetical protein